MAHLLDVVEERAHRVEERPELGAGAEPVEVTLGGVPLDPQDVPRGVLRAAGELPAEAVRRRLQRRLGLGVPVLEGAPSILGDPLADVLDDHTA